MYWGYIIYSRSKDRFYIGTTGAGVEIRVERHNNGWTKSTKAGIPWKLKFVKTFESKSEALKWERWMKRQKSRTLIEQSISDAENELNG